LTKKPAEITVPQKDIRTVLQRFNGKPGALLSSLEEVQALHPYKYLPEATLKYIGQQMDLPLSQIYSVVTFYAFFNLQPQGEHTIVVCRGTACHTRKSKELLTMLKGLLNFDEDQLSDDSGKVFLTTLDNKFTIKTVACFGQCALAPVVEIDGQVYGYMPASKLKTLVQTLAKQKAQARKK
jgi:NADH-quinone oxidoreductase subunit E